MNSKVSMMKSIMVAAALMAGVSGIARADDSSMSPFTGDSYAYFNGGYSRSQVGNPVFATAPSAWRQSNPNGISERQLQAVATEAPAYALNTPVFDKAPSPWHLSNPHGLSERQFQALASEAPAWQMPKQSATALASTPDGVVALGNTK